MHVFVTLQDIWSLVKNVVQEFCHEKCCPLILFTRYIHFILKFNVVTLKQFIFSLGLLELFLNFIKFVLQKVDQVFVGFLSFHRSCKPILVTSSTCTSIGSWSIQNVFGLQLLNLLFESFDNLLAEMASLCQLLFNLFVDLDVAFECLDLSLHLIVFVYELLSLLRLVFKLCRQLVILEDRKPCSGLKLLVVEGQQVCLRLFDLVEHLFSEFLRSLNLVSFLFVNFCSSLLFFISKIISKLLILLFKSIQFRRLLKPIQFLF